MKEDQKEEPKERQQNELITFIRYLWSGLKKSHIPKRIFLAFFLILLGTVIVVTESALDVIREIVLICFSGFWLLIIIHSFIAPNLSDSEIMNIGNAEFIVVSKITYFTLIIIILLEISSFAQFNRSVLDFLLVIISQAD